MIKKTTCLFLIFALICSMASCASKPNPVGKWYNKSGRCLDIRSDATYKLENDYGTGRWKILSDGKTIEFIDFYGDTQDTEINIDEYGKYIDFGHYGNFYQNSYPVQKESNSSVEQSAFHNEEASMTVLDPFKGLSFEVTGISPYCEIMINNADCDEEVQKNVKYELDKEYYANGEKAVIAASTANKQFQLKQTESTYLVNNQPEFITSVSGLDFSSLKSELNDFITSNLAEAIKRGKEGYAYSNIIGVDTNGELQSVSDPEAGEVYFQVLKPHLVTQSVPYYNCLTFTFSGTFTGRFNSGEYDACISARNIIQNKDGSIQWGAQSENARDFVAEGTTRGMQETISACITVHAQEYNINTVVI